MKIRKNDTVLVITGKDKGKKGKVRKALPKEDKVVVEGLNMITPHYWALEGIQNVIARGMGMEGVLMQSGILLGMAVLFFAIGASRFKFE